MEDIDHGSADDTGHSVRVNVNRKGEIVNVSVILYKVYFLDEERRRFHHGAFGTNQATGVRVEIDSALEEAGTLAARLQLVNVHYAILDLRRTLIRELVVLTADCGQASVVLLHVIDLGLQQASDYVG